MTAFYPEKDTWTALTRRPFIVLDTETTWVPDGGPQRLVALAYTPVRGGIIRNAASYYQLINPGDGVTMYADSTARNHITTEDLQGKPSFADIAEGLTEALTATGAILVCHNAAFDVAILRNEYSLAGLAIPDIPVLDTMLLPDTLDYAPDGLASQTSLLLLAGALGVSYTAADAHHAGNDAKATAQVLTKLLRHASTHGTATDIDTLLEKHNRGTTTTIAGTGYIGTRKSDPGYELPAEHLMRHTDAPTKGAKAMTEWLDRGHECALLRCPLLTEEAQAISEENREALFRGLRARIDELTEPGQLATLTGTTMRMLSPTMKTRSELTWWKAISRRLPGAPGCYPGSQCPDCRQGLPCPLDVGHEYAAASLILDNTGKLPNKRVGRILDPGDRGWLRKWASSYPRVAGHAAELIIRTQVLAREREHAGRTLDYAQTLGLHKHDPRLAVRVAHLLVGRSQHDEALALLETVKRTGSTNPADHAVTQAAARITADQTQRRPKPPSERIPTPSKQRPKSRTRANPWRP